MNPEIYLHHYPASLFSEKIRLMLGYLKLPWRSVEIASIMPRPFLMPLTGGYRKTPTLQIGANIFCDTAVITSALVRHSGDKSLFAPGFTAHRVAQWADTSLFQTTVALNFRPEAIGGFMSQLSAEEVAAFQKDRAELSGGAPIVSVPAESAIAAFHAYLQQLETSLNTPFLFGNTPCIADFSVYHCLWFVNNNPVNAEFFAPFGAVREWLGRMNALGHGTTTPATPEEALDHATRCEPVQPAVGAHLQPAALGSISIGDKVTITPTDYGRIAVIGKLVGVSAEEVVIAREDPQAGRVMTHFPLIGFVLASA